MHGKSEAVKMRTTLSAERQAYIASKFMWDYGSS